MSGTPAKGLLQKTERQTVAEQKNHYSEDDYRPGHSPGHVTGPLRSLRVLRGSPAAVPHANEAQGLGAAGQGDRAAAVLGVLADEVRVLQHALQVDGEALVAAHREHDTPSGHVVHQVVTHGQVQQRGHTHGLQ